MPFSASPRIEIDDDSADGDIFSVKFSPDGNLVAAGCTDGVVRIYDPETGRSSHKLGSSTPDAGGITAIRWRPHVKGSTARNILAVASSDGWIRHYHVTGDRMIHENQEAFLPEDITKAADPLKAFAQAAEQERLRVLALQRAKTAESAGNPDAGKGAEASASGAGASESKSGDAGDADAGGADAAGEHPHGAVALAGGQSMPVDVSGVVAVSEVPGKLLSAPDALPGGAGFMAPHGIRLNQVLCLDYSVDGALLASGGEDKAIRIYDESRHAVARVLRSEYASKGGHANRVFAVAFHRPAGGIEAEAEWEPWSLASAAWDQTVQLWDLRQARPTACCHGIAVGPRVEGEGLVYRGDEIIVASARPKEALQVWDRRMMGMGAKDDAREGGDGVRVVEWSLTRRSVIAGNDATTPLFAAAVSAGAGERAGGALLVAGGGNTNELRLFDRARGDRHIATVSGMCGTVYSCDFSPSGKLLAIGGQRAKAGSGGQPVGAPLLRVLRIEGESSGDISSSMGAAVELSSPDSAAAGAESASGGKGQRVGFDAAQIDEALGGSMMGADDGGDAEADAVVDRMKAKQAAYHAQSADTAAAPAAVGESLPRVAGSGPAAVRALRARMGASAGSGADGTALADEGAPASSGAGADLAGNRDEPMGPISAGAGESKQGDAGD